MSAALAEPVDLTRTRPVRPALRVVEPEAEPVRTGRRRPGPGVGPAARPRRLRFVAPPPARAGSCRVAAPRPVAVAPAPAAPTAWRLTERGVAVVLVVAAALVAASVAVVALTALRVTSESYHPGSVAVAPVVAGQP